eukprot:g68170.t1
MSLPNLAATSWRGLDNVTFLQLAAFRFSDPSVASNDAKSIAGDTDKDKLARHISMQWDCTTALSIFMETLAEGILVDPSKATTGGADSSGSAEEIKRLRRRQELADQKLQLDIPKRRADEGKAFGKDGRTGPSAAGATSLVRQSAPLVNPEFPPEVSFSAFQSGNQVVASGQQHSLAESQPKKGFQGSSCSPADLLPSTAISSEFLQASSSTFGTALLSESLLGPNGINTSLAAAVQLQQQVGHVDQKRWFDFIEADPAVRQCLRRLEQKALYTPLSTEQGEAELHLVPRACCASGKQVHTWQFLFDCWWRMKEAYVAMWPTLREPTEKFTVRLINYWAAGRSATTVCGLIESIRLAASLRRVLPDFSNSSYFASDYAAMETKALSDQTYARVRALSGGLGGKDRRHRESSDRTPVKKVRKSEAFELSSSTFDRLRDKGLCIYYNKSTGCTKEGRLHKLGKNTVAHQSL